MRKKQNKKIVIIIIGILALITLAYTTLQLTGLIILGKPVEIIRTIQPIDKNNFLVKLNVELKGDIDVLGIREKVNMTPCSKIYDISDEGVLKFDNVIEWLLVKKEKGLNAPPLQSKTISYKIKYEECLNKSELWGGEE